MLLPPPDFPARRDCPAQSGRQAPGRLMVGLVTDRVVGRARSRCAFQWGWFVFAALAWRRRDLLNHFDALQAQRPAGDFQKSPQSHGGRRRMVRLGLKMDDVNWPNHATPSKASRALSISRWAGLWLLIFPELEQPPSERGKTASLTPDFCRLLRLLRLWDGRGS